MKFPTEDSALLEDHTHYKPLTAYSLYIQSIGDLNKAPYDLWILFVIKFLVTSGLSSFFLSLPIYISDVKNLPDMALSFIYAGSGLTSVIYVFLVGSVPDKYGTKLPIIVGTIVTLVHHLILLITTNLYIQFASVILLGPLGLTLTFVAFDVSIKYYTHFNYRSLAIALFTALNYLSLIMGGVFLEILMLYLDKSESTFRLLFITGLIMFSISLILSFFLRSLDCSIYEDRELEQKKKEISLSNQLSDILSLKLFWRLCVLVSLILTIKIVFYQQTVILPLYMLRDFGDDSHYGLTIILNQVVIILTIPLFNYFYYFALPFDFFIYGGLVAVVSLIPFLFGPSYYTIISYIVISSIAESIYGPKLLEYCLEISPKGKEGAVLALISLPGLTSTIFSGIIGGILLDSYCPEDGEKQCWMMWLIVGAIASFGIVVLFFCRKWIEEPNFESRPFIPCVRESQ